MMLLEFCTPPIADLRRGFTDEFKGGAVRLVRDEGKSIAHAARDLDLTVSALRLWVERARADRSNGKTGLTSEERVSFPRFGGRFDYAASAILAALSNSPGLM